MEYVFYGIILAAVVCLLVPSRNDDGYRSSNNGIWD